MNLAGEAHLQSLGDLKCELFCLFTEMSQDVFSAPCAELSPDCLKLNNANPHFILVEFSLLLFYYKIPAFF